MQLTVLNATPQKRRFFLLGQKSDTKDVNSITFGAWQSFELEAGSSDYTAYYERIAADRLELVMKMEADRMRGLTLSKDDWKTEREVIIERLARLAEEAAETPENVLSFPGSEEHARQADRYRRAEGARGRRAAHLFRVPAVGRQGPCRGARDRARHGRG